MTRIKKLTNGITVILEEMPYSRSAAFGVWVHVGSRNEDARNNGIAHVIEHMLFKGTKHRDAKQIADEMAKIGGNVNAFTSKECTSYYATTLSEHLPRAIDIIADMINNSLFEEKALKKEKGVIIEEIDMYDDSSEDLAHEMLQMNVWKGHPLGYQISGTKENVRKISREQILEFMDRYYVGENMIISVAGQFDAKETLELLEDKFGTIKAKSDYVSHGLDKPDYNCVFYKKEKDVEQVHMNIAFDCISYHSKEKYILSVLNSILGGSINSRLFIQIREYRGLTYNIYSYGSTYRDAGLFHIYAAMNPTQTEAVVQGIYEIINDICKNGITLDELQMTKEQLKTEIILGNESTKSRMTANGRSLLYRGRIVPIEELVEGIEAVTFEEVKDFANRYLDLSKCSISLVGNIKDIDQNVFKPIEIME
ncbi:MAG: insulinase family protein [Clostridiales bacterium]|nr:insulinase family protein [Clostridiales bacterium]